MNLKTQFTTVTFFSKIVAAVLFVGLPFLGFWLGTKYQEPPPVAQLLPINSETPTPTPVQQEKLPDACVGSGSETQAGLNACSQATYEEADSKLTKVYEILLKEPRVTNEIDTPLKEKENKQLKKSQDLWEKYLKAECDYQSRGFEGGSAWPMIFSGCEETLTKKRINELLDDQIDVASEIPDNLSQYRQN